MDEAQIELLTALLVVLLIVITLALIGVVVVVASAYRLLKKVHNLADSSSQGVRLFNAKLAKNVSLFSALKYVWKKRKQSS